MRKTLVIAVREYQAAVRTKTFIISLVIMPVMASAGLIVAYLFRDVGAPPDKRIAVIDHTDCVFQGIRTAADDHNRTTSKSTDGHATRKPRYEVVRVPANAESLNQTRAELSNQVRSGEYSGFIEISPDAINPTSGTDPDDLVTFYSNNPMNRDFTEWLAEPLNDVLKLQRCHKAGLDADTVGRIAQPVDIDSRSLFVQRPDGTIAPRTPNHNYVLIATGMGMSLLLCMVVLVGAMPLTYSVLEEKIQRSAEVLLGSVTPFQFMMGKLLGMIGVSLTIVTIYLAVGFVTADGFGFGQALPRHLINWFVLFQAGAILMFGSMYIAIGAACSDMKDAQNLMAPASLIACTPLFLIRPVMLDPGGTLATTMSFFPPATPMLMLLRQSLPTPVPTWQPFAGLALVVFTAVACVAIAARIFRVGILMQGQSAGIREICHWAFAREGKIRPRSDRRKTRLMHTDSERPRVPESVLAP